MRRACTTFVASLLSAPLSAPLWAAPVELDTPGAHIIVTRPVDEWSGDAGALSDSLSVVKAKKAHYHYVYGPRSDVNGGTNVFGKMDNDPITVATAAELRASGFEPSFSQGYAFTIQVAQPLAPTSYKDLVQAQGEVYRALILSQGDPETLQSRLRGRKIAGGFLSVLTVGLVGAKFGANAAGGVGGNGGVIGSVYQLPLGVPDALAPAGLPSFDPSPYQAMEIHPVTYRGGLTGQIIIAYVGEKTREVEIAALAKGIAACAGVGTTEEEIQRSRDADFEYRKTVWKACLEAGDCKDGVYSPKPQVAAPAAITAPSADTPQTAQPEPNAPSSVEQSAAKP
jgi:hypothetical protein